MGVLIMLIPSQSPKVRSSNIQGLEKENVPAQVERWNLPFLCFFVLFIPFNDWLMESSLVVQWLRLCVTNGGDLV